MSNKTNHSFIPLLLLLCSLVFIDQLDLLLCKHITCNHTYSLNSKSMQCSLEYTYLSLLLAWSLTQRNHLVSTFGAPPHLVPRVADLLCIQCCEHSGAQLYWILSASSTIVLIYGML